MKVVIFGAGGKTGDALVTEALRQSHTVTAFVHTLAEYKQPEGVHHVVEGDAQNAAAVDAAVNGQDAVLDAIGGSTPCKETTLERNAARNIVSSMSKHDVRRLLVVSVLGAGESKEHAGFLYEHVFLPTFLRGAIKDKDAMEAEVQASTLEWTLVRPPFLKDDPATNNVKVLPPDTDEKAHKITRADLARWMVAQLGSGEYVGKAVVVANS